MDLSKVFIPDHFTYKLVFIAKVLSIVGKIIGLVSEYFL